MPGIDGVQLVREIRLNAKTAYLPLIMLSSSAHAIMSEEIHAQVLSSDYVPCRRVTIHFWRLVPTRLPSVPLFYPKILFHETWHS